MSKINIEYHTQTKLLYNTIYFFPQNDSPKEEGIYSNSNSTFLESINVHLTLLQEINSSEAKPDIHTYMRQTLNASCR